MKRILKNRACISIFIFILLVVFLYFAERLAPFDPNAIDMAKRLQAPGAEHILGTDSLGRDLFSRILAGASTTVGNSLVILAACLAVGIPLGLISGYAGGRVDWIMMRLVDTSMTFPDYIVAIVLSGLLGPGTVNLVIAIVMVKWFAYTKLVRSIVLTEKSKEYIASAKLNGLNAASILFKHLIPHVTGNVVALAVVDIGKIILMIASLSYIGLGVQPPQAEWGSMLSEGRSFFSTAPYLMVVPGLAILLVVLMVNIFGSQVASYFDITSKRRQA